VLAQPQYRAHEAILSAMRTHTQSVVVQQNGCWAIGNLAINGVPKKPSWGSEPQELGQLLMRGSGSPWS